MTLFAGRAGSLQHLLMLITAVVLFILLLPIIIPLLAFTHWQNDARMRKLCAGMHCEKCGIQLGDKATRLADRLWAVQLNNLKKQSFAGKQFRLVRKVHAICPACGLRYNFQENSACLVPETKDLSAASPR